ncbi:unnamed protein product, partial [marine sediment metagenome]
MLKGKAKEYSYLHITNDGFALKNAEELRGSSTKEATRKLKAEYGKYCGILVVGPAAENGVLFANMHVDDMNFFGRGGQGLVLASKNLKAIVVQGQEPVPQHANPDEFTYNEGTALYEAVKRGIANNRVTKAFSKLGTPVVLGPLNDLFGALPTRNFRDSHFEEATGLKGEVLEKTIKVENDGCFGCPIRCKRRTKVGDREGHGPEYETLYALGSSLGIGNLEIVTRLNYLCNELG